MSKRVDKIRKKVVQRRREVEGKVQQKERSAPQIFDRHDEARDEPDFYLYQDEKKGGPPQEKWMQKDLFLFRLMAAVCLFLIVAILFKTGNPQLEGARQFVQHSYEHELQFAQISNWYENQFGRPMALLPMTNDVALEDFENEAVEMAYAVPASGHVTQSFEQSGTGVLVETEADAVVEAVKGGQVTFVDEEVDLGNTVVIQHYDGGESWYGMLDEVEVNLYDHVSTGTVVGSVSKEGETEHGQYYFALKQGEDYIDPIEVISFD
ncbi:M23 family metallopeptidase [Desertibacillus haloalkaliphilus]|uniref:M23 family metallopeptidase n=1 Tax=Desertibacillus haloalkaliphilus TaxID=1328930 RepID=UPI001C2562A4|nr:M23 family metallopeptidase [Desertibacillus haloalkaliphilus]MBU8905027.1 M23 family metallopeptidase [Desertibacillus haloalkaliphilus]